MDARRDLGGEAFVRRLDPARAAPIAVAFSGGGDSLAALLATRAWAERCGRRLLVLTVDHRLQPQSAAWTAFAADTAARLGAAFQALSWEGEKPSRGLPAAARTARHRLLAEAARAAGAGVIVVGHTADDRLEGEVMRAWGSTLGALREWSPSPVWPEGRGVFLFRPLLGERRAALRAWLTARGEPWIEDPANVDPAQTRARARLALAGGGAPPACPTEDNPARALADAVESQGDGALVIDRATLRDASASSVRHWLAAAALSAGGGGRPPRGARLDAVAQALKGRETVRRTLCGARIVAEADRVVLARDAGEVARGGLAAQPLPIGRPVVWDGRFEITADRPGLTVRMLGGRAARLDPAERKALRAMPVPARAALPAIVDAEARVTCPILANGPVRAHDLAVTRMRAACGAISKESAT